MNVAPPGRRALERRVRRVSPRISMVWVRPIRAASLNQDHLYERHVRHTCAGTGDAGASAGGSPGKCRACNEVPPAGHGAFEAMPAWEEATGSTRPSPPGTGPELAGWWIACRLPTTGCLRRAEMAFGRTERTNPGSARIPGAPVVRMRKSRKEWPPHCLALTIGRKKDMAVA